LLLLGVSVVVFAVLYAAPRRPAQRAARRAVAPRAARRARGAERPRAWYGQYGAWLWKVLQGDFGSSIRTGLPVLPELARVGVNTLYLTLGSLLLTFSSRSRSRCTRR